MRRVLFLVLATACGNDATTTAPDDAAADGSKQKKDAAPDGNVSWPEAGPDGAIVWPDGPCPATAPSVNGACTSTGLLCEYGSAFWPGCDSLFVCDASGVWKTDTVACPTTTANASCPADFVSAHKGTCTPQQSYCEYPEGRCECVKTCGGPPDPNPIPGWACDAPDKSCAAARPRFGTACASEGQACRYEICCSGADMVCANGLWRGTMPVGGCP